MPLQATTRDGSLTITILDLKDQYAIDEPLNFTLSIKGYGYFCSNPTAKIFHAGSRLLAYDIPEGDFLVYCRPEPRDIDISIRLEDIMFPYSPILLGEPGNYTLVIEFEGVELEKDFAIRNESLSS
jgi:hypothetical protein